MPCGSLGEELVLIAEGFEVKELRFDSFVEGFDVGLEMSGNGSAFREMLDNMCHGGRVAILGIPSGEMAIDWKQVVFNMLTLQGIYGREMYESWYMMTVMLESGLDISPVITHRFAFDDYEEKIRASSMGKWLNIKRRLARYVYSDKPRWFYEWGWRFASQVLR